MQIILIQDIVSQRHIKSNKNTISSTKDLSYISTRHEKKLAGGQHGGADAVI